MKKEIKKSKDKEVAFISSKDIYFNQGNHNKDKKHLYGSPKPEIISDPNNKVDLKPLTSLNKKTGEKQK